MNAVYAEVITIGDEILYGQTLDTNTQFIGEELNHIGIKIKRKTAIGDQKEEIITAIDEAFGRADIILITGGLGPTKDDITKITLSEYFGTELYEDAEVLERIRAWFKRRNRPINSLNESQARLPRDAFIIPNKLGTASGMWFEKKGQVCVSMPGVPYEMKAMMEATIIPKIKEQFQLPAIYHKMIKTVGIGESWIAGKIEDWEKQLPDSVRFAYLPSLGQVRLRLTGTGKDLDEVKKVVEEEAEKLIPLVSDYIYGYGDIDLEAAIGQLLLNLNKTVAFAESCSGGYVAHTMTRIPGSSRYFQGGVVPYHNAIKEKVLGVNAGTLEQHGAVSEATVIEMARQVRTLFNADLGLSSSGVAGPGGGSDEKPVGTVWIAFDDGTNTYTKKLSLTQNRMLNIELTAVAVLNLLRRSLLGLMDKAN